MPVTGICGMLGTFLTMDSLLMIVTYGMGQFKYTLGIKTKPLRANSCRKSPVWGLPGNNGLVGNPC